MYKKLKSYEKFLWLFVSLISLVIAFYALLDSSQPEYYINLFILPLSFAIINLCSFRLYSNLFDISNSIAKLIVHILFFIRQSLAIYFLVKGNYVSTLNKLNLENINSAILLMIFETICVYICLNYYGKFRFTLKKISFSKSSLDKKRIKRIPIVGLLLLLCVTFCTGVYIISPLVKSSYSSIFDSNLLQKDAYFLAKMQYPAGSIERILFTMFNMVFDFTRILLPCWTLFVLRKQIGEKFICIIIGLIMCSLQFTMILNENVYILIVVLITGIVMIKLFPKYKAFLIRSAIIGGCTIVIAYFIMVGNVVSISTGSINETMSDMFQIYFPGISNIACGFNIVDDNILNTLFFDIYEAIPFHNTLFGLEGIRLSDLYNTFNNVKYTICPGVIQSYHYLGIFGSIVTCCIVKIALDTQKKLTLSRDIFQYAAFCLLLLYAAMTPVCYYPTILLARFLNTILPMILLSKFVGKNYEFID